MARTRQPSARKLAEVRALALPSSSTPPTGEEKTGVVITPEQVARARVQRRRRPEGPQPQGFRLDSFKIPEPLPGVLGDRAEEVGKLALDATPSNWSTLSAWATEQSGTWYGSAYAEGMMFLGYAILAQLSQRAEYRVPSEEVASEMTREWIDIKRAGEREKSDRVKEVEAEFDRLGVREACGAAIEYDGLLGRGHLFLDVAREGESSADDREELATSIGDGDDEASRQKVSERLKLVGVRAVEPTWTWPNRYNSTNPLRVDWYRPQTWSVMGMEVHCTRLLTIIGRPVPDILKPAYSFGGLSMTQMLKPYVDNWLRTRQAVSDLVHSFSVQILKTNLDAANKLGGEGVFNRVDFFNLMRDNAGVLVLDRDTEDWANVQTSLASLDKLQAQAQEHMAAIARIPLMKLLAIVPTGLNATGEMEIRSYYDWIHAFQEKLLRRPITTILHLVQLSLWGRVDPDITFDFKPLWQLDALQRAQLEGTRAQTHAVYAGQVGAVDASEVRESLANDPDSPYDGLDLSGPPPAPPAGPESSLPPPGEGQVEDEGAGRWARKAAALFSDPEEVEYWTRRAEERGSSRLPSGRWRALAQKLLETSNQPEEPQVWDERVLVVQRDWQREDTPTWLERAAFLRGEPRALAGGQVSQADAGYEYPSTRAQSCGGCEHFQPGDRPKTCVLVAGGTIEPEGWCRLWAPSIAPEVDLAEAAE